MSYVLGLPRGADGWYLLEMLGLAGWQVAVTADGRGGSRVTAKLGDEEIVREGPAVADVSLEVFETARSFVRQLSRGR